MEEQHKAAITKAEEACARLRARNDLLTKDKTDLEEKIKKIADLAAPAAAAAAANALNDYLATYGDKLNYLFVSILV